MKRVQTFAVNARLRRSGAGATFVARGEPSDGWRVGDRGHTLSGIAYRILGQPVGLTGPRHRMFVQLRAASGDLTLGYDLEGSLLSAAPDERARYSLTTPSRRGRIRLVTPSVMASVHPRAMQLWVASAEPPCGWAAGQRGKTLGGHRYVIEDECLLPGVRWPMLVRLWNKSDPSHFVRDRYDFSGRPWASQDQDDDELDPAWLLPPKPRHE